MPKVMIVEDSSAMRDLIGSVLGQLDDVDVLEVNNGFEALKQLPREQVDLVILDINMPGINGFEVLSFLRGHPTYAQTPVLLLTTEAGPESRRRGLALGANGYVVKPFSNDDLLSQVRRLLGGV